MLCLIKEIGSTANNQQSIVRRPPYPIELLDKPYPKNYKTLIFVRYDGRKGNTIEHVSKFLNTMGQHGIPLYTMLVTKSYA